MVVFRLDREKRKDSILSGIGAEKVGGRWNSPGIKAVYTSESASLAILEVIVHLDLSEDLPNDRILVKINIPDDLSLIQIEESKLPKNWDKFPYFNETQVIFDEFVADNKSAILKVPSVIVPEEFNYILNPAHPDFNRVFVLHLSHFNFDQRLIAHS